MTAEKCREIAARMDTSALARGDFRGTAVKALVVFNDSDEGYAGVAALRADFPTRTPGLPVLVFTPSGEEVASRIVDETIGLPDERGRRRWSLTLEFRCIVPARSAIAYGAAFAGSLPALAEDFGWDGIRLEAVETDCHFGDLPNPCNILQK